MSTVNNWPMIVVVYHTQHPALCSTQSAYCSVGQSVADRTSKLPIKQAYWWLLYGCAGCCMHLCPINSITNLNLDRHPRETDSVHTTLSRCFIRASKSCSPSRHFLPSALTVSWRAASYALRFSSSDGRTRLSKPPAMECSYSQQHTYTQECHNSVTETCQIRTYLQGEYLQ